MAQAFVTTYIDQFRKRPIVKTQSMRPVDKMAETLPEGDIWIVQKKMGEDEGGKGLAAARASVNKMYRMRLYSTYQVSYCRGSLPPPDEVLSGEEGESTLMLMCRELYKPKTQKISPPLPSSRRLCGYLRPYDMYTPLSVFQGLYGKVGYETMLDNRTRKGNVCGPKQDVFDIEVKTCDEMMASETAGTVSGSTPKTSDAPGVCVKEAMKRDITKVKMQPGAKPLKLKMLLPETVQTSNQ